MIDYSEINWHGWANTVLVLMVGVYVRFTLSNVRLAVHDIRDAIGLMQGWTVFADLKKSQAEHAADRLDAATAKVETTIAVVAAAIDPAASKLVVPPPTILSPGVIPTSD